MKNHLRITDDDRWQSVVDRDVGTDGQFVLAVQTTGILCRSFCRAKHALRKNVRFSADAQQAQDAGFHSCKRCQPGKDSAQQYRLDKIARACQLLEQESPLTLDELAQQVATSPYHLYRLFKATTGMTLKVWQQLWCTRRLRDALVRGAPMTQAIPNAGLLGSSSCYRKADRVLGMTAKQLRKGGDSVPVCHTLADCALDRCLVAESERGTRAILLGDDDVMSVTDLRMLSPTAQDVPAEANFQQRVREAVVATNSRDTSLSPPLGIWGIASQQQVWQALRIIPCGETVSYQQSVNAIGKSKAVCAVASACGANELVIVIPCHQVIHGDGALSGYRRGTAHKAQLLQRETTSEET